MDRYIEDIRLDVLRLGCEQHPGRPADALDWTRHALAVVEATPLPAEPLRPPVAVSADFIAGEPPPPPGTTCVGGSWSAERDAALPGLVATRRRGRYADWPAIVADLNAMRGTPLTVGAARQRWFTKMRGRSPPMPAADTSAPEREMGAWPSHPTSPLVIRKWAIANVEDYEPREAVADQIDMVNRARIRLNLAAFAIKPEDIAHDGQED